MQPQKPPPAETWEIPPKMPVKTTIKAVNHAPDKSSEVTSSTPEISAASVLVPPIQTKPFAFEELITEIDRDI
nr:hypothetical protein CFP56_66639 [Quercus suber]